MDQEKADAYWKANLNVIYVVLFVWFFVSYVMGILLFPVLQGIQIGYLSMGFWFAHQGAMVVFVILIFGYAFTLDRVDKKFDVQE